MVIRAPVLPAVVVSLLATAGLTTWSLASAGPHPRQLSPRAVEHQLAGLKLVDYFPAHHGWSKMWTQFDPHAIADDFSRIRQLNGNAARIIVRPDAFGFPQPRLAMLKRLARVVRIAGAHRLRVELTLFDGWDRYSDLAGSRRWARSLLSRYGGDARIAYVDLHNEINFGPKGGIGWAGRMLPYLRGLMRGVPVTVSTTIQSSASELARVKQGLGTGQPDFFDIHFYGDPSLAYSRLRAARAIAAPAPIFVGEAGFSTYGRSGAVPGLSTADDSYEAYQDYFFRSVDFAARALSLPAPAPWILDDFARTMMPGLGVTDSSGYHFGLFRVDGRPKPAATSERRFFAHGSVSLAFNGGFEQSVARRHDPAVWREWLPSEATFALDSTVAHSGRASARIVGASGDATGCPGFYTTPIAAIRSGRAYRASAWVRGRAATGASRVTLAWVDASGTFLGQDESPSLAGTTPWTRLSVTGTAPGKAAGIAINLKSCQNSGSVWFDDVMFGDRRR